MTVIDAGRIINPLTGRNQIQGAVVMGIGMALLEDTIYDPQNGAPVNSSFADYLRIEMKHRYTVSFTFATGSVRLMLHWPFEAIP